MQREESEFLMNCQFRLLDGAVLTCHPDGSRTYGNTGAMKRSLAEEGC